MSTQTIEHIVLFKVKGDTAPSEVDAMINRLNSLVSLDQVLHLSMGPVLRIQSPSLNFTHMLHCRYNSKDDLNAYSAHPSHVSIVKANTPLVDDTMALDWVAEDLQGDLVPPPGSAIRVTFIKLKENLGDEVQDQILGVIRGIRHNFREINQFTCGKNFSPGRSKGFSIAWLAVFPGLRELEAADSNEEMVKYQKDKIGEHVESVVIIDYVLPSPQAASL